MRPCCSTDSLTSVTSKCPGSDTFLPKAGWFEQGVAALDPRQAADSAGHRSDDGTSSACRARSHRPSGFSRPRGTTWNSNLRRAAREMQDKSASPIGTRPASTWSESWRNTPRRRLQPRRASCLQETGRTF